MPIYEYVCRSCGHETEIMHKISDPPATDCPECSKPALTKLISAAGFRLAGGGWYETDFKSSGKRNLAGEGEKKKDAPAEACKPAGCDKPGCAATKSESSSSAASAATS